MTIPHKQAALALADRASEAASAIGAANTLTFHPDGTIAAENTDAPGLIAALGQSPRGMRVLVLGAGGSARAAAWALREAGASEVSVWNRTPERARALARDLGVRAVGDPEPADLLDQLHLGRSGTTAACDGAASVSGRCSAASAGELDALASSG